MTRGPDYPELRRFFEGYMHEDFVHEYGTPEGAVGGCRRDPDPRLRSGRQ